VTPIYGENEKRRWRVKDTIYSRWRDLPGIHTGVEIWAMLNKGRFSAAIPAEATLPKESASVD